MSEFLAVNQSFALPAMTPERRVHEPFAAPARQEISAGELWLHGLKTPGEIADIMHLRSQIRLPDHVVSDPGFAVLEKKETKQAWSPLFAGATSPSVH